MTINIGFLIISLLTITLLNKNIININEIYILILQFILAFIGSIIYLNISKNKNIVKYSKKISMKEINLIIYSTIILLLLNFSSNIIFERLNINVVENEVMSLLDDPLNILILIPIMIFIVGPVEEYIFRGIIQGIINENYSFEIAVVTTSILFSFIHIPAVGGLMYNAIPYLIVIFILSIILGYTYKITNNIIVPSLIHGLYNAILLVLYGLFVFYF